jgi:ABC-type multidrug transport system fused ATPase/permease subunit
MSTERPARRSFYIWFGFSSLVVVAVYLVIRFLSPWTHQTGLVLTIVVSSITAASVAPTMRRLLERLLRFVTHGLTVALEAFRDRRRARRKIEDNHVAREMMDGWGRTQSLGAETDEGSLLSDSEAALLRHGRQRHARERLAVGVMTREFEKSLTTSSVALFLALLIVGGYAAWSRERGMMIAAVITGGFFLLAVGRQAILAWRTRRGYFGSSEHEVRELLAFAMRHPTPDDFFDDNGHLLPAFDLRPEQVSATAAIGQPSPGAI